MSVVSSRVSSVSSILKATGARSQLIKQSNKVYFKLPKDVKCILNNFQTGNEIKEYENLIQLLRDGSIKDGNLAEFLTEVSQYVASLSVRHELFIQALLRIHWLDRSPEVIFNYKLFLQNLICVQPCHIRTVIHHLIELLKPDKIVFDDDDANYKVGNFKAEDVERLNHIHDVLHKILEIVPMSDQYLLQSLEAQFPYMVHSSYTHQMYIYALLKIMEYAPKRRSDILSLIINKLTTLDVNMPREEIEEDEEEDDSFNETANDDVSSRINNDTNKKRAVNPIVRTLDACMELFLKYMHEFCFANGKVLQIESLRVLYVDVLRTFETIILTTHASRYVQYITFYICSFKPIVAEMFVDWLWRKASNPNVSPVLRQSAAYYISSLCANASFVTSGLVKLAMSKLVNWIHEYLARHEYSEYIESDAKAHIVFYSICQAFFHLFIAKYKEFVALENGILFLQELNIPRIVNCKLNPLKTCDPQIVDSFAEITSTYQLAYCYTIIANNERNQLPIFGVRSRSSDLLSNVFPFESYALQHSGQRIVPLLRYNITDRQSCEPIRY